MTSNPHFAAEKTDLGGEESSQSRAQDARGGCGGNKVLDQVFLSPRPSFAESGGGGPFPQAVPAATWAWTRPQDPRGGVSLFNLLKPTRQPQGLAGRGGAPSYF